MNNKINKKFLSDAIGPIVASLIIYIIAIILVAGYYVTHDERLVLASFILIACAPIPFILLLIDALE